MRSQLGGRGADWGRGKGGVGDGELLEGFLVIPGKYIL